MQRDEPDLAAKRPEAASVAPLIEPTSAASALLTTRYASARERLKFTWLMAALTMLGPFSIDTYLPAFPAMEAALPATEVQMQLTLTVYFIGFAIVSLFHGAISDAVGRKPVIVGTLCVHAAASIGCALSGSIESLLAFRALQGCFAGAGFVVGRAVVRDIFAGDEAQRQLSRIQMLFAAAPIIAPILGGWMVAHLAWPSIFWFLGAFAVMLTVWSVLGLPESHPPEHRLPLAIKPLARTYWRIFFQQDFSDAGSDSRHQLYRLLRLHSGRTGVPDQAFVAHDQRLRAVVHTGHFRDHARCVLLGPLRRARIACAANELGLRDHGCRRRGQPACQRIAATTRYLEYRADCCVYVWNGTGDPLRQPQIARRVFACSRHRVCFAIVGARGDDGGDHRVRGALRTAEFATLFTGDAGLGCGRCRDLEGISCQSSRTGSP